MMKIDVCIVAGRRPDLLQATLESFERNLFLNFQIQRFIVNIDPIFGTPDDQAACISAIRAIDPDATIHTPSTAGFAAAVIRNWSSTSADVILHLEDDWLLTKPVTGADVADFADTSIGQIAFNHANKNWDTKRRGGFAYTRRTIRFLGAPTPFKAKFPVFTTSPSFLRGPFAREAARLMDPAFDPEKQFFKGVNFALETYVSRFKSQVLDSPHDYRIVDIGRGWRDQRNILKTLAGWQSQWVEG